MLPCDGSKGKQRQRGKEPGVLAPAKCSRGCKSVPGSAGYLRIAIDVEGSSSFLCGEAAPTAGVLLSAVAPHQKSPAGELLGMGRFDCGGVVPLPLLLHRPFGLCQLFQVFPPTSCLHLLGIPVPAACPAIKQHMLRAGCQGLAMPPLRRWDPLPGSQHQFLPASSHPAAGSHSPFPSPAPHLGVTPSSPTPLPRVQGLYWWHSLCCPEIMGRAQLPAPQRGGRWLRTLGQLCFGHWCPRPEVTGLCSLSLQLEEEHTHVFLHQLCGLHLRAGPDHIHHAHLQARPGELRRAACRRCTSQAGHASLATRFLRHARKK